MKEASLNLLLDTPPRKRGNLALAALFPIFPISVNHIWMNGRGRTILSPRGKKWYDDSSVFISMIRTKKDCFGYIPKETITKNVEVEITLFPPDKKIRDVDNYIKGIFDAFTKNAVWIDDSIVKKVTVEWGVRVPKGAFRIKVWADD